MRLIVSREAVADLDRLRTFLVERNPVASRRATTSLMNAIRSLDVFPDRGRPAGDLGLRELIVPFGRSAYVVRYAHTAEAGEVIILRIWHGREERE